MTEGGAEPTMRDLMSLINRNRKSLEEKLGESTAELKTINNKLSGLEGKLQEVDRRVKSLEQNEKQLSSKREVQQAVNHLKEDINESRQRQMRQNNRVIFGIPENDDGLVLLEELISILAPGDRHKIDCERFGKTTEDGRYRPIRMYLVTPYLKRKVLSNLSKLKGIEKFKSISVNPDLTKLQRLTGNPYNTRSGGGSAPKEVTDGKDKESDPNRSTNKRGADGKFKEPNPKRAKSGSSKETGDVAENGGTQEGPSKAGDVFQGDTEEDEDTTMTED